MPCIVCHSGRLRRPWLAIIIQGPSLAPGAPGFSLRIIWTFSITYRKSNVGLGMGMNIYTWAKNSLPCKIFIVESKMIVVHQFKNPLFPLKTEIGFIRGYKMAKKGQPKYLFPLLPSLPIDAMHGKSSRTNFLFELFD
jgi:hypothetical protein